MDKRRIQVTFTVKQLCLDQQGNRKKSCFHKTSRKRSSVCHKSKIIQDQGRSCTHHATCFALGVDACNLSCIGSEDEGNEASYAFWSVVQKERERIENEEKSRYEQLACTYAHYLVRIHHKQVKTNFGAVNITDCITHQGAGNIEPLLGKVRSVGGGEKRLISFDADSQKLQIRKQLSLEELQKLPLQTVDIVRASNTIDSITTPNAKNKIIAPDDLQKMLEDLEGDSDDQCIPLGRQTFTKRYLKDIYENYLK